jgi:hypothetical protein
MTPRFPLFIVALALLAGCVTADITLKDDGSAKVVVNYPALDNVTVAQTKPMLTAPGVTIDSIAIAPRTVLQDGKETPVAKGLTKTVTATLTVTDLAKLSAIPLMKLFHLEVATSAGEDGQKTVTATLKNPTPIKGSPMDSENVITIHVPGQLGETTATAEAGAAVWKFTTPEYFRNAETKVSVSYGSAKEKAAAGTS